ncbi:MAG: tetratricopeptide repeat protein [Deltaproteobacteria bacterium]|nr:tetratricopeptide repeat protein [Deltaproteobacteria bacterium]
MKRSWITKVGACGLVVAMTMSLSVAKVYASPEAYRQSYQLESQKKYGEALKALETITGPDRGTYFYSLRHGWLSYLGGKYQQAIASYKVAIRLRPGAVEPLLGLTLPQMALRAWVDALRTAKAALVIDKKNYTANSRLALCEYNLGRYKASMKRYRKILVLYPGNLTMRLGLGWAQLKAHDREAAGRTFAEVLKRSPNNASAKQGAAASQ